MIDESGFLPAPLPSNESRRLEAVRRTGVKDVANADLFIVNNELAKAIDTAAAYLKTKLNIAAAL